MPRSRCGLLELRQHALDLLAMRFEEGGQLQVSSELGNRLVDRKARNVGCDLEQHAAGFTEVDRAEVVTVLLLGRMEAGAIDQPLRHGGLCGIVWRAEGDMMHRARALRAAQKTLGLV